MENLVVIKEVNKLEELRDYIIKNDFIAFDCQTTGVDKESKIIGFSFSAGPSIGYYVALSYWDVEQQKLIDLPTKQHAHSILKLLEGKNLVGHNFLFDAYMVQNNYRIDLMQYLHTDTMIAAHLLNERRSNGLKDLGVSIFGDDAKAEQTAMKESVHKNGGQLTKDNYELYKADADLMGKYGAKDAVLTIKLFYLFVEQLYAEGLDEFFYKDESMPLLKGPTYDLNTVGLRIDSDKLASLKGSLEADCMEAKTFIYREIDPLVSKDYPGTKKTNTFNIGSTKQLAWLLFIRLGNEFSTLTKEGKNLCKSLGLKVPYSPQAKREFIRICTSSKGHVYSEARINPKTKKLGRPKKVGEVWNYIAADRATLKKYANKYKWVEKFLEYNKNLKLLNTYVEGLESRIRYNIIRPSFLQHGTTSGRYSSKNPNFQNLPRDDKRVKSCIVARPGKVFVGADYSQLESRVFASFSNDTRLLDCFKNGDDFYSVIGAEVFGKLGYSLKKDEPNSFAKKYPELRNIAKTIALSATYGTTAPKMAPTLGKSIQEASEIIDDYFDRFPSVKNLMLESHALAKKSGKVLNLFGRPRRMPEAMDIDKIYGNTDHSDLPYEIRNTLNLAINHRIQSTGASIINRAAIEFKNLCKILAKDDKAWYDVHIVMQVHDELIVEGPEIISKDIATILKEAMEHTVELPGVDLVAEPVVGYSIADLK